MQQYCDGLLLVHSVASIILAIHQHNKDKATLADLPLTPNPLTYDTNCCNGTTYRGYDVTVYIVAHKVDTILIGNVMYVLVTVQVLPWHTTPTPSTLWVYLY